MALPSKLPGTTTGHRTLLAAAAVGILGTAVSAIGSGTASLWGDEAASLLSARRSLPSLLAMVQNVDAVHGTYYLGLHFWILLAGTSPTALRFPSAVAIGAAAAGLVLVGARLRGLRYGILAGLLGAALPRMTDIGSEARSFAFSALIAVALTLLAVLALQRPRPRRRIWVAYGVLLALGIYVFLYLALIAISHLVVILLTRRDLLRDWSWSFVAALAAALPVVILAISERGQISYLETRQLYDITALFIFPWFENPVVAAVSWPLLLAGAGIAVREWRRGARSTSTPTTVATGGLLPVAWLLIPPGLLLAASVVVAVFTPRYLAMSAPAVALLVAIPLDALVTVGYRSSGGPRRLAAPAAWLVLAGLLAVTAPTWAEQRTPFAKNNSDWAQISAELGRLAQPGDAVAFDDATRPSRRPRLALRTYPAGFSGLVDVTLKTPYPLAPSWYDETYTLAEAHALGRLNAVTRIWLVEYAEPGVVDRDGVTTLTAMGFHRSRSVSTHRSEILEYVRAAPSAE